MFVDSMTKAELIALIKTSVSETVQKMKNEFKTLLPSVDFEYCTIQTVADKFKVTKATVHNWAKNGRIKKYKICGRTLYKLSEIERKIN